MKDAGRGNGAFKVYPVCEGEERCFDYRCFVNGRETPRISGQNALDALRVIWKIQEKLGFIKNSDIDSALTFAAE